MTSTAAPTATERFAFLVEELGQKLGWMGPRHGVAGPVLLLIWQRVRRLFKRFASLVTQIEAGTAPPARPRATARPATARPATATAKEKDPVLALLPPQRDGWVTHLVPECACVGGAVEYLLYNVPKVAEMHAAEPRMGRILRPMCRMFGVRPPPWLALPRRPRAARKEVEPPPPDAHPEMLRWPHVSLRQRFGPKWMRDRDNREWEAETGKKWE